MNILLMPEKVRLHIERDSTLLADEKHTLLGRLYMTGERGSMDKFRITNLTTKHTWFELSPRLNPFQKEGFFWEEIRWTIFSPFMLPSARFRARTPSSRAIKSNGFSFLLDEVQLQNISLEHPWREILSELEALQTLTRNESTFESICRSAPSCNTACSVECPSLLF